MVLFDVLKMISRDRLPLSLEKDNRGQLSIDSRPDSIYKITLCFMCEEETWITVYPESEILVPWYACEVAAISPSDKPNTLEIWLKSAKYLNEKFSQWLYYDFEKEEAAGESESM